MQRFRSEDKLQGGSGKKQDTLRMLCTFIQHLLLRCILLFFFSDLFSASMYLNLLILVFHLTKLLTARTLIVFRTSPSCYGTLGRKLIYGLIYHLPQHHWACLRCAWSFISPALIAANVNINQSVKFCLNVQEQMFSSTCYMGYMLPCLVVNCHSMLLDNSQQYYPMG